jgi:HPt (histidine-containing phosphotransfer) domain-containing protein
MEVSAMRGEITKEMFECIPEIDFNTGYRYFLGNMENYTKALMAILKSIKSKLPLLQSMYLSEEYEGLRTITQTLRKMLGNVGATALAETSYQLELALFNDDGAFVQDQLSSYIIGLIEISDHLELLLKRMDSKSAEGKEADNNSFLNYDFTKTKESIRRSADLLERKII